MGAGSEYAFQVRSSRSHPRRGAKRRAGERLPGASGASQDQGPSQGVGAPGPAWRVEPSPARPLWARQNRVMTTRIPGYVLTDHLVEVPLDHAAEQEADDRGVRARGGRRRPRARRPAVTAVPPGRAGRQVSASGAGGRMAGSTRPRRTGCSCWTSAAPGGARARAAHVEGWPDADIAAYLRLMRADSIVRDAEVLRERVAGGRRAEMLAQGYGGVGSTRPCTSFWRPHGVDAGDELGLVASPGLHRHGRRRGRAHVPAGGRARTPSPHVRYPDDVAPRRLIVDDLASQEVLPPYGDGLTTERLRRLGSGLRDGAFGYVLRD